MKPYLKLSLILILAMMILPAATKLSQKSNPETALQTSVKSSGISTTEKTDRVFSFISKEFNNINLTEYIIGIVAGEIPASFSQEALKAQAVASYTYLKYLSENTESGHISESSKAHLNYLDTTKQKEKWGDNFEEYRQKIEAVVKSVSGQYLSYNNEPALTLFHAISSGKTKSSQEICGSAIPYLCAVDAPGDILSENYEAVITVALEEFQKAFEEKADLIFSDSDYRKWACVSEKDDDGYIKTLTVCNEDFSCSEISKILNLPGTSFRGKIGNECFIFIAHGKGHGVGMSQYSADYMARQGADYKEILNHFYPGTVIKQD